MSSAKFHPGESYFGGYHPNDGYVQFYSRVNSLIDHDSIVVDLGAGRGAWQNFAYNTYHHTLRLLRERVNSVIGVDVDESVLENGSLTEARIIKNGKLPLDDSSVDLIFADWVLEHVEHPSEFAREVTRCLKPGGYFCAKTPYRYSYISLVAGAVPNRFHKSVISFVQPNRDVLDVFPTYYRLNNLRSVERYFSNYDNSCYLFSATPRYYFGSKLVFKTVCVFRKFLPDFFTSDLYVFLRKADHSDS